MQDSTVQLFIYDLEARGKQMKLMKIRMASIKSATSRSQISHLSIVVYGKEHTFTADNGIVTSFAPKVSVDVFILEWIKKVVQYLF